MTRLLGMSERVWNTHAYLWPTVDTGAHDGMPFPRALSTLPSPDAQLELSRESFEGEHRQPWPTRT